MTPALLDACTGCGLMVANAWASPLTEAMAKAFATTPKRQAAFLAQVAYESSGFSVLEEDLDYSADRLLRVFPTHFTGPEDAGKYAHQPQRIANRVYANRMGNGDEASGDGWLFHGRGLVELTGKDNYTAAEEATLIPLTKEPYLASLDFEVASSLSGWFWGRAGLNVAADTEDFAAVTKGINGGLNGFDGRVALYQKARAALGLNAWVPKA